MVCENVKLFLREPIVSHGELEVLAALRGWGAPKLAALRTTIDNLVTVDINSRAVVSAYVELDVLSQRHSEGSRNMGKNDLWIAACTKAAGAKLLTTDNDFQHLIPEHIEGDVIDPTVTGAK